MFSLQRLVLAQNERALMFTDKRLTGVLQPGVHRVTSWFGRTYAEVCNISQLQFHRADLDTFLKSNAEVLAEHLEVVRLGDFEVALVFFDGVLGRVLEPRSVTAFWKDAAQLRIEVLNIQDNFEVESQYIKLLRNASNSQLRTDVLNAISVVEVPNTAKGLLYIDGQLTDELDAGVKAYWKFHRKVVVDYVDTRVRVQEVSGQEILTKDKVSLRVNLTAQYRIKEPKLAKTRLSDVSDFLYKELQLVLRETIGTRTLDTLLSNKGELDQTVFQQAASKLAKFGIDLNSAGVKDIILPGEMKTILNQVVEAEKTAQANVIRRREETAATRSLLNTAKLMDQNPTLLRLKELETLEKVTEKVDKLTVFGGLDGVLQDTVRINVADK